MAINYDLSWASVVVISMMVDPLAFMVIITLIFATIKASVRVWIHHIVLVVDPLRMSSVWFSTVNV